MLQLRNKKKLEQALWRPDFRDRQALPDTKAVRTTFLLNFVSIAIALVLGSYYAHREFSIANLGASVGFLRNQVDAGRPGNRSLLESNRQFKEVEQRARDIIAFEEQPMDNAGFIRELAVMLPDSVVLERLRMFPRRSERGNQSVSGYMIQIDGTIVGGDEKSPSEVIADLQERLKQTESLSGSEPDIDLTRFNRNNELGIFGFSLQITIPSKG
jgi:Tfp pilus assembly protein PilN